MGAVSFIKWIDATNPRDAFDALTKEAREEYGRDAYNGTISTCSMGRQRGSFNVHTQEVKQQIYDYISSVGNGEKWVADYIDGGVVYYLNRTVEVSRREATSVYRQKFVVEDDCGRIPRPVKNHIFDKKTDALNKCKELAIATGEDYQVTKKPVLLEGNDVVATIRVNTEKAKKPKKGSIAIRRYFFYGWAAD
jgi:hypothetical protein